MYIYRDKAGFDHAGEVSKMLARGSLPRRAVTPQEMTAAKGNGQQAVITVTQQEAAPRVNKFDGVVVCVGVASRNFSAQPGDRVNLYPVKGYSITLNLEDAASQMGAPQVSLLDDETKLVTSSLGLTRFRVAGTAVVNWRSVILCRLRRPHWRLRVVFGSETIPRSYKRY